MMNGIHGTFNDGHHCDLELFLSEKKTGMIEEEKSILYRDNILKCKT